MKKSNVEVRLNTKATPEMVAAEKPDQLILAMVHYLLPPKLKVLNTHIRLLISIHV